MPPKRKSQRTGRTQAANPVVVVDDESDAATQQAMRETFDVASIPMNEEGTEVSQQRQQQLRSPSHQQAGRNGARAKRSTTTTAPAAATTTMAAANRDDADAAAAAAIDATFTSLAQHTLDSLVTTAGAASATADSLLNTYRRGDQAAALCAILNLIAKASGVEEVELDGNAFADGLDISPLLEELYARVPADSAAYLLVNKDTRYRRLRKSLPEFGEKLIRLAWSSDVLLDGVLLPTLAQWVISMSESKSRGFRHTATVLLLGFLQGFNVLYSDLKQRTTLARTKKETTELEKSLDEIARWRDHFFSQAVHQRLRDVAPEIRLGVFQALKGWILEFREEFMTNKYLRYFGMPLHDKKPELRAEALDMVWQALYTIPDAHSRMHLFLQYFVNRLVEMSNDVDVRCAELAIRVVALMVREDNEAAEGSELLQNTMIDRVLLSLFDERPTIRTAAGILLKVFIHCRTADEDTEAEQVQRATELLGAFANMLRLQNQEKMPEKYLIDALWSPERLPLLLTEYKPMLAMAQSGESSTDTVVGLSLLTALLLKLQGRLTLGPLPKDDRRGTAAASKKLPKSTQETVDDLGSRISNSLGAALPRILKQHRGDCPVLCAAAHAVAALDPHAFASGSPGAEGYADSMLQLRHATLQAVCDESTRDALAAAWHAVAFPEHPQRAAAQAHLAFLLKQVVQQVGKAEEAAAVGASVNKAVRRKALEAAGNAWSRLSLVSSLLSANEHWPLIKVALARQLGRVSSQERERESQLRSNTGSSEEEEEEEDLAAARAFELLEWMLGTAVNCALWRVNEYQCYSGGSSADAAAAPVHQMLGEVVAALLQCLRAGESILHESITSAQAATIAAIVSLRGRAVVYLCDVAALRFYDLPQVEQEALVDAFGSLFEYWSAQLSLAQGGVKVALSQQQQQRASAGTEGTLSQVVSARYVSSHVEAQQMRLVMGVARLFLFKRLDADALAPRVLVQWTQTSSKAVSDTFKGLFHALCDRAEDSFHLERDILLTAYGRCAEVGATPVSVDALYQIGSKLASTHFGAADRCYTTVPAMVQFAADFAVSTDPLMLQGVSPYCCRLRAPDALRLVRHVLAAHDLFTRPTNLYASLFVAAMRKAAKLEEYLAHSSAALSQARLSSAGSNTINDNHNSLKRSRELLNAVPEHERDEHLLREIANSVAAATSAEGLSAAASAGNGKAARGKSKSSVPTARMSVATRVVTEDGWRELPSVPVSQEAVSVKPTPQALTTSNAIADVKRERQGTGPGIGAGAGRRPGAGAVNMPSSQEMALSSSLADGLNTEAFIATEDFE